jgi:hypothetical protein
MGLLEAVQHQWKRWGMFTRLTDTSKAMVFTVLVLFFALAAGLTINVRQPEHGIVGELTSFLLQVILYSLTFVLA